MWQGVGKMFVKKNKKKYLEELKKDQEKGEEAIDTLKKKLVYVDVSVENARKRLEQLLKAAGQE